MNLNDEQFAILHRARLLGPDRGQVLEGWAYPDAHELAEQGWLERRFVGDELAWFLTAQGDVALDGAELLATLDERQN
jgi:hypothetical protein